MIMLCLLASGCTQSKPAPPIRSDLRGQDRLKPNEPLPGRVMAFGIEMPRELNLTLRERTQVQLEGHVSAQSVASHIRKHVVAEHVELGENTIVFPRVYLKGDKSKRVYRIDISSRGNRTRVKMADLTRPKAKPDLTPEERWEQAGRNPDGTLKDRLSLY